MHGMEWKKRILAAVVLGMILCTGCGKEEASEEEIAGSAEEFLPTMEGAIEVVEDLPDRAIEVPEYLKGEEDAPAEDEAPAEEDGEAGRVDYLSGEEQTEEARRIAAEIEDSINQVLTDKDFYPNITGIAVNAECTEFNVTFSGKEISLYENVLPMSLCIAGNKFQLYQGKQEDELMTVVNYFDESGEIFNTMNSGEIE